MRPISNPHPVEPESLVDTGLPESTLEQLILKVLYFRGDTYGQDLSQAIGLKFSVIQELVEGLKLQHMVQVKRSLGMGSVGALLALTDSGRGRAKPWSSTSTPARRRCRWNSTPKWFAISAPSRAG